MLVCKAGLFVLSTFGSFQLLRRLSGDKIGLYFLPSLTVAVQVTVLFFAGVLNLLPEAAAALYLAGLAGFALSLWKDRGFRFLKDYGNDGYVCSAAVLLIMGWSLRGMLFAHPDNFSHWAIVVRHMLEVDRFPNLESVLIRYQEYPLGSSVYLYYVAKMIGGSEPVQMTAQTYMIVAAALPLFSLTEKRSLLNDAVYLMAVNLILLYNIPANDLLVDTLLPAVWFAAFLFAKQHCLRESAAAHFWLLACYLTQLIQIKNSGVFFAAAVLACGIRAYRSREYRLHKIASGLFPFATLAVWHGHCARVFTSAAVSKHAMTLENYRSVFGDKSPGDVKTICAGMLRLSTTGKDVLSLFFAALTVGALVWLYHRRAWRDCKVCLLFSLVFYGCYQAGMLAMYLFSMPVEEALRLASGDRYLKTVILALLLTYTAFVLRAFSDCKAGDPGRYASAGVLLAGIFLFVSVSRGSFSLAPAALRNEEDRLWIEERKEQYAVPMGASYCVLVPDRNIGHDRLLLRYIFMSDEVSTLEPERAEELDGIRADYIFVRDPENETVDAWIRETYPEQYGNDVILREGR